MRRLIAMAAVVAACGGTEDPASSQEAVAAGSAEDLAALASARAATARYHDVEAAVKDGFLPASPCVASPAGTMGFHYVNAGRVDATLAPDAPEALLYVPQAGGLRLVAVEYTLPIFHDGVPYVGEAPPDPADVPPTPSLFGQAFDGPMPGHAPGDAWHFDLHVWVWAHNPDGTFAQFNPAVACE